MRSIRPGYGMHPKFFKDILGKKAAVDMEKGDRIKHDQISK